MQLRWQEHASEQAVRAIHTRVESLVLAAQEIEVALAAAAAEANLALLTAAAIQERADLLQQENNALVTENSALKVRRCTNAVCLFPSFVRLCFKFPLHARHFLRL